MDFEGRAHYPITLATLPRGWAAAFLEDACASIQSGFASGEHNASGEGIPHVRPMNVSRNGQLDLNEVKFVARGKDARRLARGDVVFNNTNSPVLIGKTCAVSTDADLAFSNHMTRLRPADGLDYRFLAHQLHYLWMAGFFLHRCQKHVNQASVSSQALSSTVPIVIPPSAEQFCIVQALDSYFTSLDDAVATLERVQRNLKRYRASVLKAAVEGRLVPTEAELARAEGRDYEPASVLLERILAERRRRWEEAELAKMKAKGNVPRDDKWKAKYQEPEKPDLQGVATLPAGWSWTTLDSFLVEIEAGKNFKCDERPPEQGEVGVVKVSAVTWGTFNQEESKTCTRRDLIRDDYFIKVGDFLISRANTIELVGACVVVRHISRTLMLSDKILRLTFVEAWGAWLLWTLRSRWGREEIERLATGNQESMRNISQANLRRIRVPLPPADEAERIVRSIETALSTADQAMASVGGNEKRCARLRQSILKWAFEGRLVDQDPSDEPASVLLERIRAEREASPGRSSRSPRRPRARRGDRE